MATPERPSDSVDIEDLSDFNSPESALADLRVEPPVIEKLEPTDGLAPGDPAFEHNQRIEWRQKELTAFWEKGVSAKEYPLAWQKVNDYVKWGEKNNPSLKRYLKSHDQKEGLKSALGKLQEGTSLGKLLAEGQKDDSVRRDLEALSWIFMEAGHTDGGRVIPGQTWEKLNSGSNKDLTDQVILRLGLMTHIGVKLQENWQEKGKNQDIVGLELNLNRLQKYARNDDFPRSFSSRAEKVITKLKNENGLLSPDQTQARQIVIEERQTQIGDKLRDRSTSPAEIRALQEEMHALLRESHSFGTSRLEILSGSTATVDRDELLLTQHKLYETYKKPDSEWELAEKVADLREQGVVVRGPLYGAMQERLAKHIEDVQQQGKPAQLAQYLIDLQRAGVRVPLETYERELQFEWTKLVAKKADMSEASAYAHSLKALGMLPNLTPKQTEVLMGTTQQQIEDGNKKQLVDGKMVVLQHGFLVRHL